MTIYRFDDFQFDERKLELRKGASVIDAQPRVLDLLGYLLANRERLVSKGELVDVLWDGRTVSDDAISRRISMLRAALGDKGSSGRYIGTVYGKGIIFRAEVEIVAGVDKSPATAPGVASPDENRAPGRGRPPSLAILPFRLASDAGRLTAMAEGIPDDITSSLVKLRSVPVIARASAFRFAAADNPAARLRDELGVDLVLAGRLEVHGEALTLYAELIRTEGETLVWSENYRGDVRDAHAIREEIVNRIVNAVELAIPRDEARRARLKMPADLDAWEAYHLGQAVSVEALSPDYPRAETYFRKAIELAPKFGRAHASLAYVHFNFFSSQNRREENRIAMLEQSEQALALDPEDPVAQLSFGVMRASLGDIEAGETHLKRCLELAPNYARGHASLAGLRAAQGRLQDAIATIDHAIGLSPRDPHLPTWLAIRLVGNGMLGRMDDVRSVADELSRMATNQIVPLGWSMTGYSMAGDQENARAVAARLGRLLPKTKASAIPGDYDAVPAPMRALLTKAFRDYDLLAA